MAEVLGDKLDSGPDWPVESLINLSLSTRSIKEARRGERAINRRRILGELMEGVCVATIIKVLALLAVILAILALGLCVIT